MNIESQCKGRKAPFGYEYDGYCDGCTRKPRQNSESFGWMDVHRANEPCKFKEVKEVECEVST